MEKSFPTKGALVAKAAVWLLALSWLFSGDQRPSQGIIHSLRSPSLLAVVLASGALILFWSTSIGRLSRTRLWSPQWTFLVAAMPFYLIAIWTFFFSNLEMRTLGYERMLLMVCFGSASGQLARKKAHPEFSDKDSPSSPLPPPTLFPK